jgi:DNA topoisomerase-1
MAKLVIVESPTKAKTIRTFLPKEFKVEASMGHVRDLPSSASEIPTKVKRESWARLGVNVDKDFEPLYVIPATKKKIVTELRELMKQVDELLLATDEDREGESIGWHLVEVLKPKSQIPVKRMVFHEITRDAIQQALSHPRDIDLNLVRAQEARRILDRLVGYTLSPLLWKKIAPKLSAGRVQSVAVRLLVLRERERHAFRSGTYWDLKAILNQKHSELLPFEAQLISVDNVRLATGRDFDESSGQIVSDKKLLLLDQQQTEQLKHRLQQGIWRVTDLEEKESIRTPAPPFTTATLQMEANRKLGFAANETMRTAQKLYENGYITYMRTDSVNLSEEAVQAARKRILDLYGGDYLNPTPRQYKTKTKGAQEAHEAIRPAGDSMLPPDELPLSGKEKSLYDMIWKRAIATQMAPAKLRLQTATISVEDALFRGTGRKVDFPGFFRAYVEGSDDPEAALENQESPLPPLKTGEELDCQDLIPQGHETKPPARYTEATLVKALEAEGVGRPSTYASIIGTVVDRGYVIRQKKELVPTFTAYAVINLLEEHFPELVDLRFTADMEQKLDDIAAGDAGWLEYLRQFYLGEHGLSQQVSEKAASVDPRTLTAFELKDQSVEVRIGQFGPFLLWNEGEQRMTAGIPPDLPPAELTPEMVERLRSQKTEGPQKLGEDPETGLPIYLKTGPYGPYVQLGEDGSNGKKPKRVSLLKNMKMAEVDCALALKLLDLPRTLGDHPETGKTVKAGVGRFGPFVLHERKYASIKEPLNVLDIQLEEAVELLASAESKRGGGGNKKTLKDLGFHPTDGKPIRLLDGRYGPYISHGRTNATLPKEVEPEEVNLDQALKLLETKKAAAKTKSRRKAK